jgi:hypothetical protein
MLLLKVIVGLLILSSMLVTVVNAELGKCTEQGTEPSCSLNVTGLNQFPSHINMCSLNAYVNVIVENSTRSIPQNQGTRDTSPSKIHM